MKSKNKILVMMILGFLILLPAQIEAKVCVGANQIAALAAAGSRTDERTQSPQNQPTLQNPPVMRALAAERQYVRDGVYLPDPAREREQNAYNASRAALDQQPLMQPAQAQPRSNSSGFGWGTLAGMIPSNGGGGKCRGICY